MIVAQITDIHLGRVYEGPDGRIDPLEELQRAVDHLNGLSPRPDVVLATGDLTNAARPADYAALRAALDRLDMPVYAIPGNHDDRAQMRATFGDQGYLPAEGAFLHYSIEDYPLRLIGLDTLEPGEIGGNLCGERLAWLEQRLSAAPDRPTLVFMHHPPFETGIPFFDGINCRNGAALGDLVGRHPQIELILCGHVHRAITLRWHGTVIEVTPSTGYQYELDLVRGHTIDPVLEPPACRVCLWKPGVGLISHLSYIV